MASSSNNQGRPQGDLQAFFQDLQPYCVSPRQDGPYTPEDRLRDFRKVFQGSPEGKRVLAQIVAECEGLPVTLNQIKDHSYLAFRAGKREVGLRIVKWMEGLPPDPVVENEDDE